MKTELIKFPSTQHIESSALQKEDSTEVIYFSELKDKNIICEEKLDGGNSGISFDDDLNLCLQSRGHFLKGGDLSHFDRFKSWANTYKNALFDILGTRYIMYGEWMNALHSIFYDELPDYFMEFDIYDKEEKVFFDTCTRLEMVKHKDLNIHSVKVLGDIAHDYENIPKFVRESWFISKNAIETLKSLLKTASNIDEEIKELLISLNKDGLMEGLYLKWEDEGIVKGRYKYVRPEFVQTIIDTNEHWAKRSKINNRIKPDEDN